MLLASPVHAQHVTNPYLRRLGVLTYLPALDLVCSCCEEVDQLNGFEAGRDNLVYGALGSHLAGGHSSSGI